MCQAFLMAEKSPDIIKIPGSATHPELEIFTNRILNYRYHWHETQYEITTVLCGRAVYSRKGETAELTENDVIIIDPLMGHASLALEKGTVTITLLMNAERNELLSRNGTMISFRLWHSSDHDRSSHAFRLLRSVIADIMLSLLDDSPFASLTLDSHCSLLIPCLMRYFHPEEKPDIRKGSLSPQAAGAITAFLENHYSEKISLEDLASFTGYNRTYLSSFFKTNTGLNFHEYLTRIRLKHSLSDLAYTDKLMTATALDNGFSDLKTFASIFKANFHITPSAYRELIKNADKAENIDSRLFQNPRDELVINKLRGFSERGLAMP